MTNPFQENPARAATPSGLLTALVPEWAHDLAPPHYHHTSESFADVLAMDAPTFRQCVSGAYRRIFEYLDSRERAYPVRFWAFVPHIHQDLGNGLDRYMAFNAGRYDAFVAHFGAPAAFGQAVPTASAVGVPGDRFSLFCLAANEPGLPIENPRQVSAYHYTRRYGPMPPCFARATLLYGGTPRPLLLVGGTASITGEESRHLGELHLQADETLRNLACLAATAAGRPMNREMAMAETREALAWFRELRVYYTHHDARATIDALVRDAFAPDCRIEWLQSPLCRADLLIEIEGVAYPPRREPERLRGAIQR